MPERQLAVGLGDAQVGFITQRHGLSTFQFSDRYLDSADRPVLGQAFEEDLRGRWRQTGRAPQWFSNLLPEGGPLRDFLATELAIKPTDEVAMLGSLGLDLPGAVTVQPQPHSASVDTTPRLNRNAADALPATHRQPPIRFSAAGVQLKLSMISQQNSLRLPGAGEFGRCFVKFAGTLPRLPNNEFCAMTLASLIGLDVPEIDLQAVETIAGIPPSFERLKGTEVFVIERFDRTVGGERIHIEDLNQVLSQWPEQKYEGATYQGLGRLLRTLCGDDDFWEFFNRVIFAIAIGNEDAHLKNWSLRYPDGRHPRLAPLYDAVATVIVPHLERTLALRFAEATRAEQVTRQSIVSFAGAVGVSNVEAVDRAEHLLQSVLHHETALKSDSRMWTSDEWKTLDDYRRNVPLIADL